MRVVKRQAQEAEGKSEPDSTLLLDDFRGIEQPDMSSQSLIGNTFIEHVKPQSLDSLSHSQIQPDAIKEINELGNGAFAMDKSLESSIVGARDDNLDGDFAANNLESFISQAELKQLLQLESNLFNLLQETSISDFMVPKKDDHSAEFSGEDFESFLEPQAPQIGGSLKNLEDYLIKGDLRNCVVCNSAY